jgi:hypothetical protein
MKSTARRVRSIALKLVLLDAIVSAIVLIVGAIRAFA